MKTQYYTASSLDGFIAGPGDDLSWLFQFDPTPDMGYDAFIRDVGAIAMGSHTYEWIMSHLVEGDSEPASPAAESSTASTSSDLPDLSELSDFSTEALAKEDPSDLSHSSHSSSPPIPTGAAQHWPYTQPTWVFTTRDLPPVPGADIRFVRGDVEPVFQAMVKAVGGPDSEKNLWVAGGGDLVGQFYDAGHLDEIIVQVASVTLGAGAPLLPRRLSDPPLRLTNVQQFGEGFVELRYEIRQA